jgi:WD40-like Beta Propeller Repeat
MQLGFLGRRTVFLMAFALAGCAQAATTPVAPVAKVARPSPPAFTPPAIVACPLGKAPVVWLPGAEQLISYCDNMLELRDLNGAVLAQRRLSTPAAWQDRLQSVVISPDGSRLAIASYRHVEVRKLPSLDVLWSAHVEPTGLGFSTDGRQLSVGESTLTVIDGQRVEPAPRGVAKRWQGSLSLNADDSLAFQVDEESKVTVWDPKKDVLLQSFELPKGVYGPPRWVGSYLALRLAKENLLIDARNPQRRFALKGDSLPDTAALSKDATRLRAYQEGDLVEWRLGDAEPVVLSAASPERTWLGPASIRVDTRRQSVTVWRQSSTGERVAQRVWAHPSLVEFGAAGEVVMDDSLQSRLLVLGGTAAPRAVALTEGERPNLLAVEPGGGRFVSATGNKLRVYRQPALDVQQTIEVPFAPAALAWRAEPPELLVADAEKLYSVALAGGKVAALEDFSNVKRIAVSLDGKTAAIAGVRQGNNDLAVLTKAGSEHHRLNSALRDLRFSPDGKLLWAIEQKSLLTVQLLPPTSAAERVARKNLQGDACDTRLTPTGEVFCSGQRLRFANEKGELVPEPDPVPLAPAWSAQGLTLTSDARRAATALVSFPAGTAVALPTPKAPPKPSEMPHLPLVSGSVRAWVVNADRSVLATLDGNSAVNTFSTSGGLRARLSESALTLIGSEDASHMVVVAADARSLTVWNTQTWQPRVELPVPERIGQVAVSKDGTRVAVLDDSGALQVVFADRSLHRYALRTDMGVRGLAFDPSGEYLALGGLPLRIVRLSDGMVLYGYAANVETKDPAVLAWVSEKGAFAGERRALPNVAALPAQPTPDLLQTFFGP